jgi:phage terminase large subunit-like protein
VADLAASLGMPLDEWQEQALEASMGERADGRWASKFIGVCAPRQNGKSQLIVARALAGVLLFGEKTIIVSAHETDTAREIWKRMLNVIEANPNLERRVTGRMDAINREFIAFGKGHDRQVIRLKARGKSGSRGFSADCLLLDEAQILDKESWGSIVPTMSAMPNPQLWLFGTPPTESDQPFAWHRVRSAGMAKTARHCWLEWSASESDDIDDPETWAKANPAFGVRISLEACADDRAAMDDDQFRRERLGMWDDLAAKATALDLKRWAALADPDAPRGELVAFGADVAEDRTAWVAVAWTREDGSAQVMLGNEGLPMAPGDLAAECERLTSQWGGVVVCVGQRRAGHLLTFRWEACEWVPSRASSALRPRNGPRMTVRRATCSSTNPSSCGWATTPVVAATRSVPTALSTPSVCRRLPGSPRSSWTP